MGDRNTRRQTQAGKSTADKSDSGKDVEKSAQKAVKEILPAMLETHTKKTEEAVEEAVEEVRKTLADSVAQLTQQVSVVLERLNELEKTKENNPPPQGGPDKRGLYPTMKDVNDQLNGEIRMRMMA